MTVYFIKIEGDCQVKIGTSKSPQDRLIGLQEAHHKTLVLIREINGDRPTEKWMHKRFKNSHIRGEWFLFDEEMMSVTPPNTLEDQNIKPSMGKQRFRELRELSGLSQEKLATAIGLTRTQVGRYESGRSSVPVWAELAFESLIRKNGAVT